MKIPVSVIIMTKNEEINIAKCLSPLTEFDEVFVVDSNSNDKTIQIAKSFNVHVINYKWDGKYPKKKQWCLENLPIKNDWVFYVDADEEVTPDLIYEIDNNLKNKNEVVGYFISYDYYFLYKKLKHGHRIYKLPLFKKVKGKFLDYDDLDAKNMWEVEGHYQPQIFGKVKVLKNRILHKDHDSLFHYFEKHNRYSDWEACLRIKDAIINPNEAQPFFRLIQKKIFHLLKFKGIISFFHSYIFKLGFLDGIAGFHFAIARSFYYWQISIKMQTFKKRQDEANKKNY